MDYGTNKTIWSRELTEQQKDYADVLFLDGKDLSLDFDYLHNGEYIEKKRESKDESHTLIFYCQDCLWRLSYEFGGMSMFLDCIISPSDKAFDKSFEEIKKRLLSCDEEDECPVVEINCRADYIKVTHYTIN